MEGYAAGNVDRYQAMLRPSVGVGKGLPTPLAVASVPCVATRSVVLDQFADTRALNLQYVVGGVLSVLSSEHVGQAGRVCEAYARDTGARLNCGP